MKLHDKIRDFSVITRPMPIPTTKITINIGNWNIGTMWENGRTNQITTEMRKYNLAVNGISEIDWIQIGLQMLDSK